MTILRRIRRDLKHKRERIATYFVRRRPSVKRQAMKLEQLEPRLLLSGDGLLPEEQAQVQAGMPVIAEQVLTATLDGSEEIINEIDALEQYINGPSDELTQVMSTVPVSM